MVIELGSSKWVELAEFLSHMAGSPKDFSSGEVQWCGITFRLIKDKVVQNGPVNKTVSKPKKRKR